MKKYLLVVFLLVFCFAANAQDTLKPYNEGKLWGYKNKAGFVKINCKYQQVNDFSEGFASVKLNGKWAFVDTTGKEITPFKYDPSYDGTTDYAYYHFSEGMAAVRAMGKWGFINYTGKEILPLTYTYAYNFYKGSAEVTSNGKKIYINKAEKNILTKPYETIFDFYFDRACVVLKGKYGFINRSGKEVVPLKYDGAIWYRENYAVVQLGDKETFIDTSGKEIIPFTYHQMKDFKEGYAEVQEYEGGPWGYINYKGEVVIPLEYESVWHFEKDRALVKKDGYWGIINKEGKAITPFKYEDAGIDWLTMAMTKCFGSGYKALMYNGKYGFVDVVTGKEVIPFKYEKAWDFQGCCADVILNGKRGSIDKKGKFTPDK